MYREIKPSPDLAPFVECFWVSEVASDRCRRILPDGCLDILFFAWGRDRGQPIVDAQVVGAMTRFRDVFLRSDESILGVRFHPGMAGSFLPGDLSLLNDRAVPLEAVAGRATKGLLKDLGCCSSIEARVEKLDGRLVVLPRITEVQHAIGVLVQRRGQLALADFAESAGVGDRQLRRRCQKHSGLAPKQLARILRFRHTSRLLREGVTDLAGLALDCGYYDQAHMVRDFRELAGTSPARFLRQHGR